MMRSYFCIDLKGKSLFLPFLAAWAAAVGGTLLFLRFAERYASPEPLLDWSFAAFAVCCLLFVVVMQAACCFALYFFVRATAGGRLPAPALCGTLYEGYPARYGDAGCLPALVHPGCGALFRRGDFVPFPCAGVPWKRFGPVQLCGASLRGSGFCRVLAGAGRDDAGFGRDGGDVCALLVPLYFAAGLRLCVQGGGREMVR